MDSSEANVVGEGSMTRIRPLHVIYLICHLFVVVVGLFLVRNDDLTLQAIGASMIAGGISGGMIFLYVLWGSQFSERLEDIDRFGLVRLFEARSVRIRHEYENHLAHLTSRVDVMGFGLRAFLQDYRNNFDSWSRRASVRVLLIDPEFPTARQSFANQRDREEKNIGGTITDDVRAFAKEMGRLINESQGRFSIRLYRCLPTVNILRIDGVLFWGPYLLGEQSRNMPTLKVREGGILFERMTTHFERIWANEDFSRDVPDSWLQPAR
jgi:hypothetical protein